MSYEWKELTNLNIFTNIAFDKMNKKYSANDIRFSLLISSPFPRLAECLANIICEKDFRKCTEFKIVMQVYYEDK